MEYKDFNAKELFCVDLFNGHKVIGVVLNDGKGCAEYISTIDKRLEFGTYSDYCPRVDASFIREIRRPTFDEEYWFRKSVKEKIYLMDNLHHYRNLKDINSNLDETHTLLKKLKENKINKLIGICDSLVLSKKELKNE